MFDSGISVKDLIDELNAEVDIALDIPNTAYAGWLNSLQQLLYSEIIKEQKKVVVELPASGVISLSSPLGIDENRTRFEDIYAIYANDKQLIKSTLASGKIFPDTFYKINNDVGINATPIPSEVEIIYIVKPLLVKNINEANVMIPIEFIDLVKSKLRGEAYKLANEDGIAAKWLNDYNMLLETFKVWIAEKSPNFGI
jgi:hypothetical protein